MNYEEIIKHCNEIENNQEKKLLAEKICQYVNNGDVIGFGSGTTSFITAVEIAKYVKERNISIIAVPTSNEIKELCIGLEIPVSTLQEKALDWCFDGADEVTPNNWLIKGKGAAMFREKLNIVNSPKAYILVDNSKFVDKLCQKDFIPIEVFPDSVNYVVNEINKMGASEVILRKDKMFNTPKITDNGNYILDVKFENVDFELEKSLKSIVGVIETGLFLGYNNIVIIK